MSPTWVETPTDDGSWTLLEAEREETCHSRSGAWQQATERYAHACRLGARAAAGLARVRLLDVGTGLGLNLAAALQALEPHGAALEVLTLELEPEVIRRGLALYERPALRTGPWEPWHSTVRAVLRQALAQPESPVALGRGGALVLCLGDARQTLEHAGAGPFDAVFLDPFSPRREPALWQADFLAAIARRMAPGAWLSTYSASFRVRAALARAGLRVGKGARVGAKGEGTLASPDEEPPALAPRVARRLARWGAADAPGAAESSNRAADPR